MNAYQSSRKYLSVAFLALCGSIACAVDYVDYDPTKIPVLDNCGVDQYVRFTADGWVCDDARGPQGTQGISIGWALHNDDIHNTNQGGVGIGRGRTGEPIIPQATLEIASGGDAPASELLRLDQTEPTFGGDASIFRILDASTRPDHQVVAIEGAAPGARFSVTGSGNVGIGTLVPQDRLEIQTSQDASDQPVGIRLRGYYGGGWTRLQSGDFLADGRTSRYGHLFKIITDIDNHDRGGGEMTAILVAHDGYAQPQRLIVSVPNANVGIGTETPDHKLHVSGAGTQEIAVTDTDTSNKVILQADATQGWVGTFSSTEFNIGTAAQARITIDPDGNVGIGITTPSEGLHVLESSTDDGESIAVFEAGLGNFQPIRLNVGGDADRVGVYFGGTFPPQGGTYLWVDDAGRLRSEIGGAPQNDEAGLAFAQETSTRASKRDIRDYTSFAAAHQRLMDAPLHTFRYKRDVEGYGEGHVLAKERLGFVADEVDPIFMWGDSIDQVSVNGLLMASVKHLQGEIDDLAAENLKLRKEAERRDREHAELVTRLETVEHLLMRDHGNERRTARRTGSSLEAALPSELATAPK